MAKETIQFQDSNDTRLEMLQQLAELYTKSGIDWYKIYNLMPKLEDYRSEDSSQAAFLLFFTLFEFWLAISHMNIVNDKEQFCELAKRLIAKKDFHKLPLGNTEEMYLQHCRGDINGE